MAEKTLLEIVQHVVNAVNGSTVNNINDTAMSDRVTRIVKEVYEQEMAYGDWPYLQFVGMLTGLSDVTMPTCLRIPADVSRVDAIRYTVTDTSGNVRKEPVTHIEDPQQFLDIVLSRNTTDSNVEVKQVPSLENVELFVRNDKPPTYWTSFDDKYVVMDSYDSAVEATLQGTKTLVTGKREPAFTLDNAFVPRIPAESVPYFLARCVVVAAERITEDVASVDRQAEQRGRANQRYTGGKLNAKKERKDYGRK